MQSVAELYLFLMRHYEPGDNIFLVGFSRGAFTVRALAGMIHVCGLLRRDDEHLLPYAVGLYKTSERRISRTRRSKGFSARAISQPGADHAQLDEESRRFKANLSRSCPIHFMGLWDTVKAYGWFWPQSFPALRHNPSVNTIRHAVSLHERRSSFQVTGWGDRQPDVKEVWFRGDHSDVGGGHGGDSPLSDATLGWMLGEATVAGLRLKSVPEGCASVDEIVASGLKAPSCEPHNLRSGWFRVAEIAPRFELDNSVYPPRRWPRCWPTGRREPTNHREGEALWFHETVAPEAANPNSSWFIWEATARHQS
jgi:hypothetical protein